MRLPSVVINYGIVVFSVLIVILVVFVFDRLLFSRPLHYSPVSSIPIIFPPFSEEEFVSTDFHYTVKINSIGLRNREISVPKPLGIFRIAVIGDSYTYGWGVEEEQTWVRLLEKMIKVRDKKLEVVNMGKPGANLEDYLEIARVGIPILEPDLVILALLQGDDLILSNKNVRQDANVLYRVVNLIFPNISRRIRQYLIIKHLTEEAKRFSPLRNSSEKNKISAQNSAHEILSGFSEEEREKFESLEVEIKEAFSSGLLNPFLIYTAVKFPKLLVDPIYTEFSSRSVEFEKILKILKGIKEISDAVNSKITFFSVPQSFYVNEHAFKTASRLGFQTVPEMLTTHKLDEMIEKFSSTLGVPYISITGEMRQYKENPDLFYPLDMHPTPEGHKLIAEKLAPKLQKLIDDLYKFK